MDRWGKTKGRDTPAGPASSSLGVRVNAIPQQGMLILEARPDGLPVKDKKEVPYIAMPPDRLPLRVALYTTRARTHTQ